MTAKALGDTCFVGSASTTYGITETYVLECPTHGQETYFISNGDAVIGADGKATGTHDEICKACERVINRQASCHFDQVVAHGVDDNTHQPVGKLLVRCTSCGQCIYGVACNHPESERTYVDNNDGTHNVICGHCKVVLVTNEKHELESVPVKSKVSGICHSMCSLNFWGICGNIKYVLACVKYIIRDMRGSNEAILQKDGKSIERRSMGRVRGRNFTKHLALWCMLAMGLFFLWSFLPKMQASDTPAGSREDRMDGSANIGREDCVAVGMLYSTDDNMISSAVGCMDGNVVGGMACYVGGSTAECEPVSGESGNAVKASMSGGRGQEIQEQDFARALAKKNQEYDPAAAEIISYRTESSGNGAGAGFGTGDGTGAGIGNGTGAVQKDFTLMVYMIGSNLESKLGSASADIAEMEDSGLSFDEVNLILYTGGSTRWQAGVPCDRNSVMDMSLDGAERVVAGTAKNADMGAYETLSAFINFCTEQYPAEHYGLILWDHGGGPLWGYGVDELFNGDGLLLSEMKLAMSHTIFAGDRKLDFVGFDACLMGNLETMTVWADYADYYVGSEELEPGDGWDYHFLSSLNRTRDPKKITAAIVDAYSSYYKKQKSEYFDPDVTLSVADLSKVEEVQTALANLTLNMSQSMERDGLGILNKARFNAKSFGSLESSNFYYDLADLGNLAKGLETAAKERAKADKEQAAFYTAMAKNAAALSNSVKSLIVKNSTNVDGAEGVTLYYPSGSRGQYYEMQSLYDGLRLNREYNEYLQGMSRIWQDGEKKDWALENPVLADKEYTMTLSKEQAETAKVTYAILQRQEDGEFIPMLERMEVTPDADGVIHLDRNPKLVVLTSQGEEMLWPAALVEGNAKRRIYQTVNTRLLSSGIAYFRRPTADAVDVSVILQEDARNGKLSIKTINTLSEDADCAGKETVEINHYDAIFYYFQKKIPTWNGRGELLPVTQWQDGSQNGSRMQAIEDHVSFALRPASELLEELYYVVTLEDESGSLYVTEPVKIKPRRGDEILTQETQKGVLTYQVFWDHAILRSYSGTDETVEIPVRVFDTPVTEIAPYAFSRLLLLENTGYVPVKHVTVPGSVKKIGSCAFYNCLELESVSLPSSVETIGSRAFENCPALKTIEIPKRVKDIGAYAFSECGSLKSVKLPSGLRYAGDGIFACCESLEEILLTGSSAYKVLDGGLYTKDGKKLLAVPAAMEGSFTVAKGTKTIASDCFSLTSLSEVILPEGLETIENYGFYGAKRLKAPAFPESLISIGKYAFSAGWGALNLDDGTNAGENAGKSAGSKVSTMEQKVQEICFGSSLTYLGKEAFAGFGDKSFTVSEENPLFSSRGGALLNKAGDALIEFSTNRLKTWVIPEGVRDFNLTILEQIGQNNRYVNNHPYQIYLPDSVIRITGRTMFLEDVVFHCNSGSTAENYAMEHGIGISYEMDPVLMEVDIPTAAGTLTYHMTDAKAVLVRYEGMDEELVIPGAIMGKPVRVIGNGQESLMGNLTYKSLRRMTLPEGVEVIAAHAFEYFGEFEVNLPDSLKVLGDAALLYCQTPIRELPRQIEDIGSASLGRGCDFSNGVTIPRSLKRVAPGAFQGIAVSEFRLAEESGEPNASGDNGNSNAGTMGAENGNSVPADENAMDFSVRNGMLYSGDGSILIASRMPRQNEVLQIPEGTQYIGSYAFSCLPITEITIPGSVKLISQYAFSYCSSLKKVVFQEGLENVGSYSFVFTGVEAVALPESCRRVGQAAFFGAASLRSLEGAPETIESYAFAYCSSLMDIKLGEGILEIGEYAFYNTAVLEARLPDSLYELGEGAFASDNPHIKSAVMHSFRIGKNLSKLGENAFGNLPISDFEVSDGNTAFCVTERMLTDKAGRKLIACPTGISGTVTIPEGVYEIGNYAFGCCETVTDLYVPDSVGVIGAQAFYDPVALLENGEDAESALKKRMKLHCLSGTAAHAFAVERGWPFALTDRDEEGNL